jgi:hypothetical protein
MDIIESMKDLSWPEKGDSIFTPSDNWKNNACFHFAHNKMSLYADGYRLAAEILIETVVSSAGRPIQIDAKVYPILFLYHHHIELILKDIIIKGRSFLDRTPKFPTNHKIYDLWGIAKEIICKINENVDDKSPIDIVGRVIKELASVDKNAVGYRYPYDKEGGLLLKDINSLNLDVLRKTMKKVTTFLDAVSEQIYVGLDYKHEMGDSYM